MMGKRTDADVLGRLRLTLLRQANGGEPELPYVVIARQLGICRHTAMRVAKCLEIRRKRGRKNCR